MKNILKLKISDEMKFLVAEYGSKIPDQRNLILDIEEEFIRENINFELFNIDELISIKIQNYLEKIFI